MNIGVLREIALEERRVALTPAGVQSLVRAGHTVWVEQRAGELSRFTDEEFRVVGGKVAYSAREVIGRSELLLKVGAPLPEEYGEFLPEQILFCFLHLAVAPEASFRALLERRITAIGYELIEGEDGTRPVLQTSSEIAGQMAIILAAQLHQSDRGGRGILIGGMPGVPPAIVVILGGGAVGTEAARAALGLGAQVIVLDQDLSKLRRLDEVLEGRVVTSVATPYAIEKAVKFADVLIGAILVPGGRAPHLVSREMVRTMKPGAVIIDISIDQGGCVETSRPTTSSNPSYIEENVIHYCVPNIPSLVARTATYALVNATLPCILEIAQRGIAGALRDRRGLARGVCTYGGHCTHPMIAESFRVAYRPLGEILGSAS